jgi:hypothetical protein
MFLLTCLALVSGVVSFLQRTQTIHRAVIKFFQTLATLASGLAFLLAKSENWPKI